MKKSIKHILRNESGQGMTEYIIIVALIAIAAIGVVTFFGYNIRDLFGSSSSALSGRTLDSRKVTPTDNVASHKGLSDFGENADEAAGRTHNANGGS